MCVRLCACLCVSLRACLCLSYQLTVKAKLRFRRHCFRASLCASPFPLATPLPPKEIESNINRSIITGRQHDPLGGLLQHTSAARRLRGQSLAAEGVLRATQQTEESHCACNGKQLLPILPITHNNILITSRSFYFLSLCCSVWRHHCATGAQHGTICGQL